MTEQIYNVILKELNPLITENGFSEKDGVFLNKDYAFKIEHDEEKKVLKLLICVLENGEPKNFEEASVFLFENPESEHDALSAGLDFADTIRIKFGLNKSRIGNSKAEITIPKASLKTPHLEALTGKVLAIYPDLKPVYTSFVEQYGQFLYIDFYKKYVALKVREVVDSGNKKQINKIMNVFSDMYCNADKITGDIIVGIVLAKAADYNKERAEKITASLENHSFLKNAFNNYFALSLKDKKVKEMLAD